MGEVSSLSPKLVYRHCRSRLSAKPVKQSENASRKDCSVTQIALSKWDAAGLARKKFFVIKPEIVSMEICYVPCWWVVLDYSVTFFSKKHQVEGRLHFIVDEVKGCGVIEDPISVKLKRSSIEAGALVPHRLDREQATKKAIIDARWKVVMSRYKRPPELQVVSVKEFYRPYYEVELSYGGEVSKQWISADAFGNYFVYR